MRKSSIDIMGSLERQTQRDKIVEACKKAIASGKREATVNFIIDPEVLDPLVEQGFSVKTNPDKSSTLRW